MEIVKFKYYEMMTSLNWDGLRYFAAAADAGSLSAAAVLLDSNQSTVRRHIDALESSLGIKLFERSVKGLSLTEEGHAVYEQTQLVKTSIATIQRGIHASDVKVSGTVRLSLPEGLGQEVLIPILGDFYQQYPNVKLVFNMSATTANLIQGEADVAIRLFRPEESDLAVVHLGEMKLGLYASSMYKKSYGLPKTLKEIRKHHVIVYGDHLSILPENQWLLNHSIDALRVLSSDSTVTRFKATVSGLGLSIQPETLAQTNADLIRLFKSAQLPTHKVWLVYREEMSQMSEIRAVADFLSTRLTDLLD